MVDVFEQIARFPVRLNKVAGQLQDAATWIKRLPAQAAAAAGVNAAYNEVANEYRAVLADTTTLVAQATMPTMATIVLGTAPGIAQRLNMLEQKTAELQAAIDVAWRGGEPQGFKLPSWAFPVALVVGGLYLVGGKKRRGRKRR